MPTIGRPAVLAGVAVALVLVVGFFTVMKKGGEAAAKHAETVVKQIDTAGDTQAQASLNVALMAAKTAYMDGASYASADPTGLAAIEPSLRYVTGASTGPNVVSVAATETDWAAAVLSGSGTCFTINASGSGSSFDGAAQACTGQAAMSAA
jgi:hypothetical protein